MVWGGDVLVIIEVANSDISETVQLADRFPAVAIRAKFLTVVDVGYVIRAGCMS